jgi:predicted ribosome quality control (RQC) complex YloA/Tae2 family protein
VDLATITAIRKELESELVNRRFGSIFQLSKTDLAIDFRLPDSRYLFLSVDSKNPRAFLIRRKLRELERSSGTPGNFALTLRKYISGAELSSVEQIDNERVLLLAFTAEDELGELEKYILAAQLTGASANLFLLDRSSTILACLRQTLGTGQQIGDRYEPPARRAAEFDQPAAHVEVDAKGLSDRLDAEDQVRAEERRFQSVANAASAKLRHEISKREKLVQKLNDDLAGHGDADKWKRFGDLLLANASSARRDGETVFVIDYFDEAAPEIPIAVDENDSLTEAAEKFFKRYTKARNARLEIEKRKDAVAKELARFSSLREDLDAAIEARDEDRIDEIVGNKKQPITRKPQKRPEVLTGTRSFVSSDGFEILVGKKAKDNDFLTFRIAKSLDTWMHAADYPGSHVVIRNPNRKEIPHRTLVEAAQLAAFYSQGKAQPKAAVHYTQKKFVNKPKGSAAGLVSLASFKTVLVEPKIGEAKKKDDE